MKHALAGLALIAAVATFEQAAATTFFPQEFKCPVGGETFTANVVGSSSSWGSRPDGRPYGTLPIYPIVECPKNGLLLADDDYSPADVEKLQSLVPSPEYQAQRATETPHKRAHWLLKQLGRDPYRLTGELLQATWETDSDWDRKVRYQGEFIAAATALKRDDEHGGAWLAYNVRAANALRELGHFDKAIALLDRVEKPEFLPGDAEERRGATQLIDGLRRLAIERNPASEPANLVPDHYAAIRCELANPALTAVETAICGKPGMAKLRSQAAKMIRKANEQRR